MNVHVYTMVHNEAILMPYFMRHYKTFTSKIIIYDNESTDHTAEIAKSAGAEVRNFKGPYSDRHLIWVKNEAYKSSRGKADWIIAVDGDEFIWHSNIQGVLERYMSEGITLPLVEGYEMVSEKPPSGPGQIYDEIKMGMKSGWYHKRAVFHPDIDINYDIGSHFCKPNGKVVSNKEYELKLLHYRLIGIEYLIGRWKERVARQTSEQVQNGWSPIISLDPVPVHRWLVDLMKQVPPVRVVP